MHFYGDDTSEIASYSGENSKTNYLTILSSRLHFHSKYKQKYFDFTLLK